MSLPDAAARESAVDLQQHVLLRAPAGSGKTGLLVQRYLRCLAVSESPEEVVAITFTNKAAAEMHERIVAALRAAISDREPGDDHERITWQFARDALAQDAGQGWNLLKNPSRLRVSTIDRLNREIASQLPVGSGLGGSVGIVDDARSLYEDAVLSAFADLEARDTDPALRDAMTRLLRGASNRLDRLRDLLRDMLQRREQWLGNVLLSAVEFDEGIFSFEHLEAVIEELGAAAIADVVAALGEQRAAELLELLTGASAHHESLAWAAELDTLPDTGDLVLWRQVADLLLTGKPGGNDRHLVKKLDKNKGFLAKLPTTNAVKAWLKALHEEPARVLDVEQVLLALSDMPDALIPDDIKRYHEAMIRVLRHLIQDLFVTFQKQGQVDFTEIARRANQALAGDGDYSDVLSRADESIRHLLVDEMQDTSAGQVELLERLTSGWTPGDGHSLFLVGDPQQSIYAFRAAEVRLFLRLWDAEALGDLPLTCLSLSANFRSRAGLVDWFNAAFRNVFPARADVDAGLVTFSASSAMRGADADNSAVEVLPVIDGTAADEAQQVAQRIVRLRQDGATGSIAVLGRSRKAMYPVVRALRDAGVSCRCTNVDVIRACEAAQDVEQLLLALSHPEDRVAWAAVLRAPWVGLSWADLLALSVGQKYLSWPQRMAAALADEDSAISDEGRQRLSRLQDVLKAVDSDPRYRHEWVARTQAVWQRMGGPGCVSREDLRNVATLLSVASKHCVGGRLESRERFLRELDDVYCAPELGDVEIMTIHKSKGLEFDHVFVVGCGQAGRDDDRPALHLTPIADTLLTAPLPPLWMAEDHPAHRLYEFQHRRFRAARRNEDMRVLYVALTRARERLYLCGRLKTSKKGELSLTKRSFVALLWGTVAGAFENAASVSAVSDGDDQAPAPEPQIPRNPRLPVGWRYEPPQAVWVAPQQTRLKPSESALDSEHAEARDGQIVDQLIGTLYHLAMERIAEEGVAAWRHAGDTQLDVGRRTSIEAGLRRMGMPEPSLQSSVERIATLIQRSIDSDDGQAILSPQQDARSEYHLAGYLDGSWVSGIVDRFYRADGAIHVIDYKASARPVDDPDAYASAMVERYRDQMQAYRRLLNARFPGEPVKLALYLAELGRRVAVDEA